MTLSGFLKGATAAVLAALIAATLPAISQVVNQVVIDASGSAPGGAAGGDLTGTYPNPTIAAIQGKTVSGTTGTGNVVFSASPAITGTMTAAAINANSLNLGTGSLMPSSIIRVYQNSNNYFDGERQAATQDMAYTWVTNGSRRWYLGLVPSVSSQLDLSVYNTTLGGVVYTIEDASGLFGGQLTASSTWGLARATSTATVPTLLPNKQFTTSGVGGASGNVSLITNSITALGVSTSSLVQLPVITTDATRTTRTICQDTTNLGLYFGSGAVGICLGTSSERYKKNIKTSDYGLDNVRRLRPISYEPQPGYGDEGKPLYGFTAEDVAPVMPKLVGLDAEGRPNSVDMVGMIPVLVAAIQRQQEQIDSLNPANDNWLVRLAKRVTR